MDFVAIDFETANRQPNSACQLAAVVVRDSAIVAEHCWLIRPPRLFFSPMNISIHGIRPADVADALTMEGVWSELQSIIDGHVLVAHNARFDMGVLVHSLAAHDVACPAIEFTCTRLLARAAWPGKSAYGLKPLGQWLGIDFKHHDALEDARCCAQIALAVERTQSPMDDLAQLELAQLEAALQLCRGYYRHSQIVSPRMLGRRGRGSTGNARTTTDRWGFPVKPARGTVAGIDPQAVVAAADNTLPLAGKRIVMLGPLRGLDLVETIELITQLGGLAQPSIDGSTDYVVACGTSLDEATQFVCSALATAPDGTAVASTKGTKLAGIRLLSERQFAALLPAGKATLR